MSEARRLPRWLWPVGLAGVLVGSGLLASGLIAQTGPRYQNFRMSSGSMEPTVVTGEQLVARMGQVLPIERGGVYMVRKRGSVFVARVVGLPGDEIEITGGGLFIGDKAAHYSDEDTAGLSGSCPSGRPLVRREHLPGGASHTIMACNFSFGQDMAAIKIPAGHYFLLGDNRSNAADSRFNGPDWGLGLVPEADVVGKAERIFWSSNTARVAKAID